MGATQTFTGVLADGQLIINKSMSLNQLSLRCRTPIAGTLRGNLTFLGSLALGDITLSQSSTPTIISDNSYLENIVITAPAGCEIEILATQR